jgi:hypothetical protein
MCWVIPPASSSYRFKGIIVLDKELKHSLLALYIQLYAIIQGKQLGHISLDGIVQ